MDSKKIVIISVCGKVTGTQDDGLESIDIIPHSTFEVALFFCKKKLEAFLASHFRGNVLRNELELLDGVCTTAFEGGGDQFRYRAKADNEQYCAEVRFLVL